MREVMGRTVYVGVLCVVLAACGGGNPGGPSNGGSGGVGGTGNSGSGTCSVVGPLGSAKGTMTATISGAQFTGGVPAGGAVYTAVPPVPSLGIPAQDFFIVSATCGDLTTIQITGRAVTGTTTIGVDGSGAPLTDPVTKQPLLHQGLLQLRANGVAAGTWITSLLGGTGTLTVSSVSTTAVSGSFSLTMVPQANTGAAGNRTVIGTFSATF